MLICIQSCCVCVYVWPWMNFCFFFRYICDDSSQKFIWIETNTRVIRVHARRMDSVIKAQCQCEWRRRMKTICTYIFEMSKSKKKWYSTVQRSIATMTITLMTMTTINKRKEDQKKCILYIHTRNKTVTNPYYRWKKEKRNRKKWINREKELVPVVCLILLVYLNLALPLSLPLCSR